MKQNPSVLGIDLAKRVFHLVGMDAQGHVVLRKRLTREALLPFVAQLPPVVIGLEACGGAHSWARRFREHGHEVKLMAPQFVQPYVKSHKPDPGDAEAICEAVTRPTMRFVPIKEVAQHDLQSLHRARARGQSPYGVSQRNTWVRDGIWHGAPARGGQIPAHLYGYLRSQAGQMDHDEHGTLSGAL